MNNSNTAIILKVQWIERSDQPEPFRIRHIGGASGNLQWRYTQAEAIALIEGGQFAYYIEKNAHIMKLNIAFTADGRKFLTADEGGSQQLLDLPEFPEPAMNPTAG